MTGFMKRAATKGMLGKIEKYLDEVKGLHVHAAVEHDTGPCYLSLLWVLKCLIKT